jgi:hypothetical protein
VLLALFLGGCAGSLNPLYESAADLIDPTDYLGVWADGSKYMLRTMPIEKQAEQRILLIELLEDPRVGRIDPNHPTSPDNGAVLVGGLVKVGDQVFLSLTCTPEMLNVFAPDFAPTARMHFMQFHTFSKVRIKNDELTLQPFDVAKLSDLLAKNPKLVAHKRIQQDQTSELFRMTPYWKDPEQGKKPETALATTGPSLLFTADAAELRQFLGKHATADIWAKEATFKRGANAAFEKRFQKVMDRFKDAEKRRQKDETPRPKIER